MTSECPMFGDHSVTVPLEWPRWMMPFCGFCRIASHGPSLVRCCAMILPYVVS